ncbi:MAG: DsbE family thiol:disulfide interchange protein [Nitrospirota bacterium]|nr:DsbE family thiol:disulfide interchange protein [Nitrospirota bacterium]
MKRFLPLIVFAVMAVFLAIGLFLDPRKLDSVLIDKPAPAFALPVLNQPRLPPVTLESMRGQVWLLNVWASWCVSCRAEHPLLVDLAGTGEVPIYGLNYKDEDAAALTWLRQWGNPYTMSIVDRDGRVGINFGVYGVPESFLIDQQGVIRYKQVGPFTREDIQTKLLPMVRQLRQNPSQQNPSQPDKKEGA